MADKRVKLYNWVWLSPVKRLDHEFAQKKEKQPGWEMMKAKRDSSERTVLNFESENHVHRNNNAPGSNKTHQVQAG